MHGIETIKKNNDEEVARQAKIEALKAHLRK